MIIILFLLTLGAVLSQPTELICWSPQGVEDVSEANDQMTSIVSEAKQMIEAKWQGLSVEEAAQTVPQVVNSTAITLFMQQSEDNQGNVSIGTVAAATIQAILNTTNGEDILQLNLQNPNNFVTLMGTIISNFNFTCIDDPNVALMQIISSLLSTLFYQTSKEQLADIIVETGIFIAQQYNFTTEFLAILTPLTLNLDLSDAIDGALLGLAQVDSEGLILLGLQNTIGGLGLINAGGIAEVIADFYSQLQVVYGIDGEEILAYVLDVFSRMIEGLE